MTRRSPNSSTDGIWLALASVALIQTVTAAAAQAAGDPGAGRATFMSICSSCHGQDGIATFHGAPSFAKGQRLEQDDATLLLSVKNGLGWMPPWGTMLSDQQILDAIAYARTLQGPRSDPPQQGAAKN